MAIFPTLTPSSRTFTPGEYPHSAFAGMSGVQNRVRNSNVMLSSQVRLTFAAITESQMLSVLTHYQGQQGTFVSFSLPSAMWNGVSDATDYQLTSYGWRYIEPPSVSDAMCANAYDVDLTLETVPPEGTAIAGLDFFVFAKLAAGIGVALSQTDLVVTATLTPGVAGVPGIDASVSWTLAAGSPAGGATASGLNATVLAFVYSESFANGLAQTVNAIFAPGVGSGTSSGDPNFANVSLLLHMDGSNGSTTFTDSSSNALAVTASGNAQISTAQSKFGGASALFDGNGDYLSIPDSETLELGGGNFTLEFFFFLAADMPTARGLAGKGTWPGSGTASWLIYYGGGKELAFYASETGNSWDIAQNWQLISDPPLSTWHHLAVTRSGNVFRGFFNGVKVFENTNSQSLWNNSSSLTIGSGSGGASSMKGNIDELRITKGVARYTADFIPPTEAFPDS